MPPFTFLSEPRKKFIAEYNDRARQANRPLIDGYSEWPSSAVDEYNAWEKERRRKQVQV